MFNCMFHLRGAWKAIVNFFHMDEIQRLIVLISALNFVGIVYFAFDWITCLVIESVHLLVVICMIGGLVFKRPSLLLPNMIYKGCFASTLLFLALQGAEQKTETKLMLLWYSIAALLCIFEMHYSLSATFAIVENIRAKASAPPSYKEVRIEDGQLPSYDDAVKAIQAGTARPPSLPKSASITATLQALDEDARKAPGSANPV